MAPKRDDGAGNHDINSRKPRASRHHLMHGLSKYKEIDTALAEFRALLDGRSDEADPCRQQRLNAV